MNELLDTAVSFLNEHITYEVIIYLITAFFAYLGYKREWETANRILGKVLAIMTVGLLIILSIYLIPKIFP